MPTYRVGAAEPAAPRTHPFRRPLLCEACGATVGQVASERGADTERGALAHLAAEEVLRRWPDPFLAGQVRAHEWACQSNRRTPL
jgi:hypothetical protein